MHGSAGTARVSFVAFVLLTLICHGLRASTFVVNVGDDRAGDSSLRDGICDVTNDPFASPPVAASNICTLRAAMEQANFSPGSDAIDFSVPVVQPAGPLPLITDSVAFRRLTTTRVTIDGSAAGPSTSGLVITGGAVGIAGFSIVRFGGSGIDLNGAGAGRIDDCWIGIDANGNPAGNRNGIVISASNANQIGSRVAGDRNVISGNTSVGIWIRAGAEGNKIYGNYIGPDVSGTGRIAAPQTGIIIENAPRNIIGGPLSGEGNVISGNGASGLYILGPSSTSNRVTGNYVGVDRTGAAALGNGTAGIIISNAPANIIGAGKITERNVISGNADDGIRLTQRAAGNLVQNNYVGTAADGITPIANGRIGVFVTNAPGTVVGGSEQNLRNIVSGNVGTGVVVQGTDSVGTKIWNNYIGTDKDGLRAVKNGGNGITISNASDTEVGGPAPTTGSTIFRNVISGNALHGIYIQDAASGNHIRGNYIGTDQTGAARLLNAPPVPLGQQIGVWVNRAAGNTVGGPNASERNIISANDDSGVLISGVGATGNRVEGNYIGTDGTGTRALGNEEAGVFIDSAADNEIGGPTPTPGAPPGNLIAANKGRGLAAGVHLQNGGATGNKIRGNLIGTQVDGITALPNANDGAFLALGASRNHIGGPAAEEGNVIAFNGRCGVALSDDATVVSNAILSNSIHANANLGIDLGLDGVTRNRPNPGPGANNLQNFPMLTGVAETGELKGELFSTPNKTFTVQFFSSPEPDPSRFGEGKTLRATHIVATNAMGEGRFRLAVPFPGDEYIRMTATDPDNNTSEFSDVLYTTIRAVSSDPKTQAGPGVFVPGRRTPVAVAAVNFEQLKLLMRPVTVQAGEDIPNATVELSYDSGDASILELYLADAANTSVTLPKRWTNADFTDHRLRVPLLAYGKKFGSVMLALTYRDAAGTVLSDELIKFRVGHFAGAVGTSTVGDVFPFFRVVRTINVGAPAGAALDYEQHRERKNARAQIYVVRHRNLIEWVADRTLTDVSGGTEPYTVTAPSIKDNVKLLWPAATEGKYDVVYDFGNFPEDPADFTSDGKLDPGDILDSADSAPSLYVEPSMTAPGAQAVAPPTDYGMTGPAVVAVPAGYDSLPAGYGFRLRGRLVYPAAVVPPGAPLVVLLHGNHDPYTDSLGALTPAAGLFTSAENFAGHDYLQRSLASRGFITASIDLDEMCGGGSGYPAIPSSGIALRAWVALKNVEKLIRDPLFAGGAVAGKIDRSRIYLWGHSRGAEAVIMMLHLLKRPADRPPGAAPIAGLAASDIKGIISVSPVTAAAEGGFVRGGALRFMLRQDVPFLLLYGSADGDVNGAMPGVEPFRHYDRATKDKFAVRLVGGNHNHFNTSWSFDDALEDVDPLTGAKMARVPPVGAALLSGLEQRDIAVAYTAAFLRLINDREEGARAYFLEPPARLAPLGTPAAPLHSQARLTETFSPRVIDDYAAFPAVARSSSGNPVTAPAGTVEARLHDTDDRVETEATNRFFQESNGALFDWAASDEYTEDLAAADRDLRGAQYVCFRVAQQPNHPRTLGAPMTISVELEDDSAPAKTSVMTVGAVDTVPDIYRSAGFPGMDTTSAAFKTFRIPIAAFATDGKDIDMSKIMKIRIKVGAPGDSASGRVAITDIEVEK